MNIHVIQTHIRIVQSAIPPFGCCHRYAHFYLSDRQYHLLFLVDLYKFVLREIYESGKMLSNNNNNNCLHWSLISRNPKFTSSFIGVRSESVSNFLERSWDYCSFCLWFSLAGVYCMPLYDLHNHIERSKVWYLKCMQIKCHILSAYICVLKFIAQLRRRAITWKKLTSMYELKISQFNYWVSLKPIILFINWLGR